MSFIASDRRMVSVYRVDHTGINAHYGRNVHSTSPYKSVEEEPAEREVVEMKISLPSNIELYTDEDWSRVCEAGIVDVGPDVSGGLMMTLTDAGQTVTFTGADGQSFYKAKVMAERALY